MNTRAAFVRLACIAALAALALAAALSAQTPPPPAKRLPPAGIAIPEAARTELTAGAASLRAEIDALAHELRSSTGGHAGHLAQLLPDIEVFHKAVDWALRYDEFFDAKQIAVAKRALATGHERAAQLRAGKAPWLDATGLIVRGHRSALDGSVQPYGLVVPAQWERDRPGRMLVWLLGRGEKRTELAFIAEREAGPPQLAPKGTLTLVPYGRFCNATKFAGEIDVFEAMAAVRAHYRLDENRLAIAGFSMGGASTWHLATHHAQLWCAAAPGAGFAETPAYAKVFGPGKPARTPWEQTLWRWYDSTGYAANLFNLPTIAYSGELDPQKQAATIMGEAMLKEGLTLEHRIGPKTEHKYEPETKKVVTARLEALLDEGRDPAPREVRLATYTLRYDEARWVRLLGMEKHWERTDIVARRDDTTVVVRTKNATALALGGQPGLASVTIDGQTLPISRPDGPVALHRRNGKWQLGTPPATLRKQHGLSGPIDDAFLAPFLFVRPTGKPLNEKVGAWASAELARATKLWRDLFRGQAIVKDDTAVTDDDLASKHIVLWGDASSNALLARLLATKKLPLSWDARSLAFRGQTYDAGHHAPVLIFPNPLSNPGAPRYVVLNSGIDFRDEAYGTNSLQTPKLPDYAIVDLREAPGPRWPGKIVDAGFFDETWR